MPMQCALVGLEGLPLALFEQFAILVTLGWRQTARESIDRGLANALLALATLKGKNVAPLSLGTSC